MLDEIDLPTDAEEVGEARSLSKESLRWRGVKLKSVLLVVYLFVGGLVDPSTGYLHTIVIDEGAYVLDSIGGMVGRDNRHAGAFLGHFQVALGRAPE